MILLVSVFIAITFTACEKMDALESKLKSASGLDSNGTTSNLMKIESKDLFQKSPSDFLSNSTNFQITANTYQAVEGRLEVDITVSHAKTYIKNVIILGLLPSNAYEVLYTPDLLITNILMKDSFSDKEVSKQFTISPTIKSPGGIFASRSFNLFQDETFEKAVEKLNEVSIKVSWVDKKGKNHTDYIKSKIEIKHPQ